MGRHPLPVRALPVVLMATLLLLLLLLLAVRLVSQRMVVAVVVAAAASLPKRARVPSPFGSCALCSPAQPRLATRSDGLRTGELC
jgi:hypothetical protein